MDLQVGPTSPGLAPSGAIPKMLRWNGKANEAGLCYKVGMFGLYPFLLKLCADGGCQGANVQDVLRIQALRITLS
jgi:hypothetical protein